MRRFLRRLSTCLTAGLMACGAATASEREDGTTGWPETPHATVLPYRHGDAAGLLIVPRGPERSRAGTIVILNDADGIDGRTAAYVEQLLGAGFAVLDLQLPGERRIEAMAAAVADRTGPVGILGFGAGGRLAALMPGLAAGRVLLYPGCAGLDQAGVAAGGPVLLLHGTADPLNTEADCARLGHLLARGGDPVERRTYPGAGYAWDFPQFPGAGPTLLTQPGGIGRVASRPQPGLAALSAAEVAGFFTRAAIAR